jgi:hypothetical protein
MNVHRPDLEFHIFGQHFFRHLIGKEVVQTATIDVLNVFFHTLSVLVANDLPLVGNDHFYNSITVQYDALARQP